MVNGREQFNSRSQVKYIGPPVREFNVIELIFRDHPKLKVAWALNDNFLFLELCIQSYNEIVQVEIMLKEQVILYAVEVLGFQRTGFEFNALNICCDKLKYLTSHMKVAEDEQVGIRAHKILQAPGQYSM